MALNTEKTYAMLFTNRMRDVLTPCKVLVEERPVDFVDGVKFLGVHLDFNLNFSSHIKHICSKLSKTVGILYRIRRCVPQDVLINLYYSLVYPYVIYCIVVWGGSLDSHLAPLVIIQKKIIRIITSQHYLAHTSPLFYETEILKIRDLYSYFVGVHTVSYTHLTLPTILLV